MGPHNQCACPKQEVPNTIKKNGLFDFFGAVFGRLRRPGRLGPKARKTTPRQGTMENPLSAGRHVKDGGSVFVAIEGIMLGINRRDDA